MIGILPEDFALGIGVDLYVPLILDLTDTERVRSTNACPEAIINRGQQGYNTAFSPREFTYSLHVGCFEQYPYAIAGLLVFS